MSYEAKQKALSVIGLLLAIGGLAFFLAVPLFKAPIFICIICFPASVVVSALALRSIGAGTAEERSTAKVGLIFGMAGTAVIVLSGVMKTGPGALIVQVLFGAFVWLGMFFCGLLLVYLSLFGRMPRFIGTRLAIRQAIIAHWQGNLTTLVVGGIMALLPPIALVVVCSQIFKSDSSEVCNDRGVDYQNKGDYDRAIQDYTKAIELKPDFALAYNNRGVAYKHEGAYDRAIRDYTKAIELKPDFALAYNNRGYVHQHKGDYDRAIQDYSRAIKLKPDFAGAYYYRGNAYDDKGELDKAIQDYSKAMELRPADVYARLRLFLAKETLGQNGKTALAEWLKGAKNEDWITQVVRMYLGEITPEACLAAASDKDPGRDKERKCEGNFYVGHFYLLRGDRDRAHQFFQACIATGVSTFEEYVSAKAKLSKLALLPSPVKPSVARIPSSQETRGTFADLLNTHTLRTTAPNNHTFVLNVGKDGTVAGWHTHPRKDHPIPMKGTLTDPNTVEYKYMDPLDASWFGTGRLRRNPDSTMSLVHWSGPSKIEYKYDMIAVGTRETFAEFLNAHTLRSAGPSHPEYVLNVNDRGTVDGYQTHPSGRRISMVTPTDDELKEIRRLAGTRMGPTSIPYRYYDPKDSVGWNGLGLIDRNPDGSIWLIHFAGGQEYPHKMQDMGLRKQVPSTRP